MILTAENKGAIVISASPRRRFRSAANLTRRKGGMCYGVSPDAEPLPGAPGLGAGDWDPSTAGLKARCPRRL